MKLRRIAPLALFIILITAIAILCMSIMYMPPAKPISGDNNDPLTNPKQPDNGSPNSGNEDDGSTPEEYHTTYPKAALASAEYIFTQSLEGEGNITIKNVHQTPMGYYIVVESDCIFGDISSKVKSLAVFKMDLTGTIEASIVLTSRLSMTYFASKPAGSSIAVLGVTAENSYLYNVEYSLNDYSVSTLPLGERGKLFTYNDGPLSIIEGEQTTIHINNSIGYLPAGEIKAIYDFGSYIKVFINTDNGYTVLSLDEKLKQKDEFRINHSTVLDILPYVENKQQRFIVIEKELSQTNIYKYDFSFNKSTAQKTSLGTVDKVKIIPSLGGFMLILTGRTKGVNLLNSNLELTMSNDTVFADISDVYDNAEHENGHYFLTKKGTQLCLIDLRKDNTSSIKMLSENVENGFFWINTNRTLTVFYTFTQGYSKGNILSLTA